MIATMPTQSKTVDVALIGAGIMSTTLGVFLKELQPDLTIELIERLPGEAQESSAAWNNAGTGHAANCELNYTPLMPDGHVDISRALDVNVEFDISRQFWSYLVAKNSIKDPQTFIHPVPHCSFVTGDEHVSFLNKRYHAMSAHHCYAGMEYSEDRSRIAEWAPLLIEGRDKTEAIAATRMATGSDVNYGALTSHLLAHLKTMEGFSVRFSDSVIDLRRSDEQLWVLTIKSEIDGTERLLHAKKVFIGAGGGALLLLEKSGIEEGAGFAGFPVSGLWLRCGNPAIAERHLAKVYGMAASGSPPMSVPHLDTRYVDGKRWILFGPFAGFSTKFLKHGSYLDLFKSLRFDNLIPMLDVAKDNVALEEYLVEQVMQTQQGRFNALRDFYPLLDEKDWELSVAGQRVQIIKKGRAHSGELEFGTEIVSSADKSMVALLGASPGASTAAAIAIHVLERCFPDRMRDGWSQALSRIIPSYGHDLKSDAKLTHQIRQETAAILGLHVV